MWAGKYLQVTWDTFKTHSGSCLDSEQIWIQWYDEHITASNTWSPFSSLHCGIKALTSGRESMQTRETHAKCTQKGPEPAQELNPQPFSYVATPPLCMQNMHRTIVLVQMTHLGGCSDSSISSQVETPLSEPHHGLVTPIFGLCNVLVYLLQHRATVGWEEHSQHETKGKNQRKIRTFQRGGANQFPSVRQNIRKLCSYPLFVGQGRVDKLAVEHAGALCVWRQEPDHKGNL